MSTTMSKPKPADQEGKLSHDPFGYMLDEWKRFLANFEEHPLNFLAAQTCPSLDLGETDKTVEIRMDLPGMNAEDINIQLTDNTITVSGERKEEKEQKGKNWYRVERQRGEFSRTLTLPCAVKNSDVSAVYREGVLHITLPKAAQAQTRKVSVQK